jgi:hypothetical protein
MTPASTTTTRLFALRPLGIVPIFLIADAC